MSAQELRFSNGGLTWFKIDKDFRVTLVDGTSFIFDRNQTHLLMLFLQEHLKK